ncbi:MAG: exodeoxyribonuclease V subunit gamma [Alteromonadaceae bacterium]|nr:exodeoxyribonuclease V subunit gamma [Alteromonadaceae bacterium]
MIYLYPANKMENLLVLLEKIQSISPLPVFSQDIVVVQNNGIQHWLNLSLAKQRGISMNMRYALPAQYLWKLIRELASDEVVPEQSPYSREVLSWRIYALLASEVVINDPDFKSATNYWCTGPQRNDPQKNGQDQAATKRYQLACQLADLYEQYLIFRPDWIDVWHNANVHDLNLSAFNELSEDENIKETALWQAKLWQHLISEQAYNPKTLLKEAIANIKTKKSDLPKRISFFGLNAMAPMWLDFIHALSEHIHIHFFHLNPCYDYWGDILTEKQAIKSISQWIEGHDDISHFIGNPLLANLGQQGREFMALLHGYSTIDIDVFDSALKEIAEQVVLETTALEQESSEQSINKTINKALNKVIETPSVLAKVQDDILTLFDARQQPLEQQDDSIVITSCHSALREVQGLHDWLLHQFNKDKTLTPKDIIVMCPQVENYAPYVNAVFTRGWQDLDDEIPPLPCSIADRVAKDAEPLVAAFIELLNLPDSRFQISQLVSLLRLPAMQLKFEINIEEIDKIINWLELAAIHWGLDQNHKQQILSSSAMESSSSENSDVFSNNFTWQQGLSRLLQGFAYGDSEVIYQDQLLLPNVEGDDAILLGKLMLIIDQLQTFALQLTQVRDAVHWHSFLIEILEELFDTQSEQSFSIINHAIESLVEYCEHADYKQGIELAVIRDFLNSHFSQPDPGRQFMVGQVTFCSMLPMRSIPFKIIAVLGLNDGEFPRQRQPLGFDLMANTPAKLGDRSRRGDDRYLFLEAIISARQALYLSYQGRNIRTNKPKEASLVLKELMEYLRLGYGWNFAEGEEKGGKHQPNNIRQLPMQPFSVKNYQGKYASFDKNWLLLGEQAAGRQTAKHLEINIEVEPLLELNTNQIISFFQHPSKVFAQQQLNLYFEHNKFELDDAEPFSHDHLQSYLLRQQLLDVYLQHDIKAQSSQTEADNSNENAQPLTLPEQVDLTLKTAHLSGVFPDLPTTNDVFNRWQQDSESFSQIIIGQSMNGPEHFDCKVIIEIANVDNTSQQIHLHARLPVKEGQLVFNRSSSAKAKDFFTLYLHQLILQVYVEQNKSSTEPGLADVSGTTGLFFDTKSQKVTQYQFSHLVNAKTQLILLIQTFLQGQCQPLLLNGDIAEKAFHKTGRSSKAKEFNQESFDKLWNDPNSFKPLGSDDYIQYFWPQCPLFEQYRQQFEQVYQPMYQALDKINVKVPVVDATQSKKVGVS